MIGLVVLAFVVTWHRHPELWQQLKHAHRAYLLAVLFLYGGMTALLVLIYDTSLRLCGHTLGLKEQTLLTMYSSIVNFFGPLQSGPGVRTVYLKKRHRVSVARYAAATAVYYLLFAGLSGLFLLSGLRPWWHAVGVGLVVLLVAGLVARASRARLQRFSFVKSYSRPLILRLALLTFLQVLLVTVIYFTELHAVGKSVSAAQTAVYTGAANFSLFVSLTPGALGIREAFLLFSQRLHHLDGTTIVAANVVDRSVYVLFLGILFVIVLGLHAKERFTTAPTSAEVPEAGEPTRR